MELPRPLAATVLTMTGLTLIALALTGEATIAATKTPSENTSFATGSFANRPAGSDARPHARTTRITSRHLLY